MTTPRPRTFIWGAAGHAKVVFDILRLRQEYEVVGFIDTVAPQRKGETFLGLPVLGGREALPDLYASDVRSVAVGFGDCEGRLRLCRELEQQEWNALVAIHPSAVVAADAAVSPGAVLCASAVINSASSVGRCAIVNTAATIDHDCVVAEAAHLAPGARLGGWAEVGRATFVGIGSIVRDRIKIGHHAIVGAGSLVLKDIPDRVLAYGHPAREIRRLP